MAINHFYNAEITNVADLFEYYNDLEPGYHWKIFLGNPKNNNVFRCGENEEELIKAVKLIEGNSENTNIYYLCIYESEGKKINYVCGCSFQINNKVSKVSGINENRIEHLLTKLIDKQENEPDEIDNNSWLENPLVQQVGQMIIGLIGSKLTGTNTLQGTSIAGVNENEPGYLLACLMQKGVTVEHLQKLNRMPDSQLKNLLLML
jgi:hypothetical protein